MAYKRILKFLKYAWLSSAAIGRIFMMIGGGAYMLVLLGANPIDLAFLREAPILPFALGVCIVVGILEYPFRFGSGSDDEGEDSGEPEPEPPLVPDIFEKAFR